MKIFCFEYEVGLYAGQFFIQPKLSPGSLLWRSLYKVRVKNLVNALYALGNFVLRINPLHKTKT